MDFHSLARKELQALCKKNKIPANITNVAMADALRALDQVAGLDDLINALRSESQEETTIVESRSAVRTATIIVEPQSSQLPTRRTTRRTSVKEVERENKEDNLLETPAISSTWRRIDAQLLESCEDEKPVGEEKSDMLLETPVMQGSRRKGPAVLTRRKMEACVDEKKSVQRAYGTRHSVRLLEKSLTDWSLKEGRTVEVVEIEGLCEENEQVEQKKDETEVDTLFDKSLDHGGEMTCEIQEEYKINNGHGAADNTKLEMGSESCTNMDGDSGLDPEDKDDSSGESLHLQVETSEKAANIIDESIHENDIVTTGNLESVIAALELEVDRKTIDNQESALELEMEKKAIDKEEEPLAAEVSDESAHFVVDMEDISIVDAADEVSIEVVDFVIPNAHEVEGEVSVEIINSTGVVGECLEINSIQDEHHSCEEVSLGNDNEEEFDESPQESELQNAKCQETSDHFENQYNVCYSEAKESSITVQDRSSSSDSDNTPKQDSTFFCPMVSNIEIQSEENAVTAPGSIQTLDRIPCVSEKKVSSPFAVNTIQGQFPRPTASTPKSSTKKQTSTKKSLSDINKENIVDKTNKIVIDKDISLRKLTKMVREKLQKIQIANKSNEGRSVSEVGTRQALHILSENSIAAAEPEQKNKGFE